MFCTLGSSVQLTTGDERDLARRDRPVLRRSEPVDRRR
jgi:hypothetical protein